MVLCDAVPAWYHTIARVFWYRIYTTNVDNLVEVAFSRAKNAPNLDKIVAPTDDFRERDQFLRSIQLVKLNGSLPGSPKDITFSWRQYGRRLGEHDTWYDHFVRDYCTHITVLIGSELNEPLLWQYIEARERKPARQVEHRPDAFLVCRRISIAKRAALRDMNIVAVEANAGDFLVWLHQKLGNFMTREEMLREARPELAAMFEAGAAALPKSQQERLEAFYECFRPVHLPKPQASHRKFYLLGASPDWQDFAHDLDAPREINQRLAATVRDHYGDPKVAPLHFWETLAREKAPSCVASP